MLDKYVSLVRMLFDLTLPLNDDTILIPGGGNAFKAETIMSIEQGHAAAVHSFSQSTHVGTHMDAAAHYIGGGRTIDRIDLDILIGPAQVIDLREYSGEYITSDILQKEASHVEKGDRLLMITGDVDKYFHRAENPKIETLFEEGACFSVDGAQWLVDNGVRMAANDFVTESTKDAKTKTFDANRPVHNILCGADVAIPEYLCNTDKVVEEKSIDLFCLPLPITGFEAAPTRVIARTYD